MDAFGKTDLLWYLIIPYNDNAMTKLNLPEGYGHVTPYIIVKDAAGLVDFMKKVLGATEKEVYHREDGTTIMHAEMLIGDDMVMCAEATEDIEVNTAGIFVYVASADEGYQKALDNGATSVLPLNDQPYGRTCGVKDPFGNTWWITNPV